MNQQICIGIFAAACGMILLIIVLKKKAQFLLNFLVRTVLGAIMILFFNELLNKQGFDINVGLNAASLLTSGVLGFPGVALLYGIQATNFL